MSCDNIPDGPYALAAIFLAYVAGICGDGCSVIQKNFFINTALFCFQKINLYYDDYSRKINPLLIGKLKDRQLALDVYDLIVSLEEQKRRRRDEGPEENWINNWNDIITIIEEKEHP